MKNMKRLLAVLLSVLMCLSCLAGLSFADRLDRGESREEGQAAEDPGFELEATGLKLQGKQPADDDIVMAIVLLQGKAPAELPEAQRAAAATRVAAQHNTLRNALRSAGISYTEEFEYDSLLNGMAINVAYGDLAKIAKLTAVKSVHIANQYAAPVLEPAQRMDSSNVMTGVNNMHSAGINGMGKVIAVLDTGITPQHEAFQVYGERLGDIALNEETAKAYIEEKGYGTYLSDKIPFAYDYYDRDNDATDDKSGHGTHVSGIAAGYAETDEGEITFCGTAPFAQIVAMKVFSSGANGGTNSGIYFAALEDCYELGVDVINMSLGAQNGNVYDYELEDEVYGNVYETLEQNGIILCAAAGNEYSMAQFASNMTGGGYVTSDYADYGVVGTPSTYDGNMSVASVENAEYPGYVLRAGDKDIPYYDSDAPQFFDALGGKENLEFVVIDGYGAPEDYKGVDVAGKIALVSRGETTFQEKTDAAAAAGASAILIYNNQDGVIYMSINPYSIPAASITKEDGEFLKSIAKMPEGASGTPDPEPTAAVNVRGRAASISLREVPAARKADATRALSFNLVTEAADLTDGNYLVVNYGMDKVFNGAAGDDINKAANYVASDADEATLAAAALTYDSADGSLKTSDGRYIFGIEGSNSMNAGETPVAMDISFDTETGAAIITNNNTQLAFNSSWDGFRFYKSSSSVLTAEDAAVSLVKLSGEPEPPEPIEPPTPSEDALAGWYFESDDEIADWTFVDKDGDGFNWERATDDDYYAYEGSGLIISASYDADGEVALSPDNWAISPAFTLDSVEEATLSLWARGQDKSYSKEVFALYAGTEANPETMTKISDDITVTKSYKQYVADLTDFVGETIYIAIRHYNCSDMFYLDVDQVEILKGKVEVPPEPGHELLENQLYACYFETEEEVEDWTVYDFDGDEMYWFWDDTSEDAYEGTGVLYGYSWYLEALEPDDWAVSPAVLLDSEEACASLWVKGMDPDYPSEVFAFYAGTENNPETMTKISYDYTATGEWTNFTADLGDFIGQTVYVAIRHYNCSDQFALEIDQFEILKQAGEKPVVVDRPIGVIDSFPTEQIILENPDGWQMSDFSSWGVTPNLTLKPMISGVGGDVYSASFNTTDGYELMSGTSMATPNLTGIMANVSQYVEESFDASLLYGDNPFVDVKISEYYGVPVQWALINEITTGTDATHFSPNDTCTRGQVVTFLWRAEGCPEPTSTENPFKDVKATDYFYKAVLWAVEKEITNGTDPGKFSPNAPCTRGQVATFQWRAAGKPAPTITENPFKDVKAGQYYYDAVLWAFENGITTGTDPDKFSPNATCTRGQIVTFIFRAIGDTALSKFDRAELAEDLVKSTAMLLADADGFVYSPRKQGAGLADMNGLLAATAYVTEPIQNLHDNADGEFEFTFTVRDLCAEGGTYQVTPLVQTDYPIAQDWNGDGEIDSIYNSLTSLPLATAAYTVKDEETGEEIEYPAEVEVDAPLTVTVPACGEVEVTVKITLTDAAKAYLDEAFPNGAFIEGYVLLDRYEEEEDGQNLAEEIHATFVGFYGDWTQGPILETLDWRDAVDAYNLVNFVPLDEAGTTYADYGYTWANLVPEFNTQPSYAYTINSDALAYWAQQIGAYSDIGFAGQMFDWIAANGYGGFAGDNPYDVVSYNPDRIAITNAASDGLPINTLLMIPYTLRNTRHLIMLVTDAETGEIYAIDDTEYLSKAYYDTDNGFWSNTGIFMFDGTDLDGNPLPDGTKVNINYYANLVCDEADRLGAILGESKDYSLLADAAADAVIWSYDCTIDNSAPTLVGEPVVDKEAGTFTITVKDAHYVAAAAVFDKDGELLDFTAPNEEAAGAETTLTFEYGENPYVNVQLYDYAQNVSDPITVFIEEPTYVTMSFVYPDGTTLSLESDDLTAAVGSFMRLPTVEGETKQGEFIGWTTVAIDGIVDAEAVNDALGEDGLFYEGNDQISVTEDFDGITWYALYEITKIDESRVSAPIAGWYFESEDEIADWTFVDGDEDGYAWDWQIDTGFTPFEGSGLITSASYVNDVGALTPDNWAISPAIDLTEINEATLSLWAAGQDATYFAENFKLYAGIEADPETMTEISADITAESDYVNYVADLSDFAGETIYVAIRHYDVTDMYWLDVDNVEIFEGKIGPMEPPEYLYTTNPNQDPVTPPEEGSFELLAGTPTNNGQKTLIVLKDGNKAVSTTANGNKLEPVEVTVESNVVTSDTTGIVFEIEIDGDGHYLFKADDLYLTSAPTGNGLSMSEKNEYSTWELVPASETAGEFFLKSVNAKYNENDQFLEFFQNLFTVYGKKDTANPAQYLINFYTYGVG